MYLFFSFWSDFLFFLQVFLADLGGLLHQLEAKIYLGQNCLVLILRMDLYRLDVELGFLSLSFWVWVSWI